MYISVFLRMSVNVLNENHEFILMPPTLISPMGFYSPSFTVTSPAARHLAIIICNICIQLCVQMYISKTGFETAKSFCCEEQIYQLQYNVVILFCLQPYSITSKYVLENYLDQLLSPPPPSVRSCNSLIHMDLFDWLHLIFLYPG